MGYMGILWVWGLGFRGIWRSRGFRVEGYMGILFEIYPILL